MTGQVTYVDIHVLVRVLNFSQAGDWLIFRRGMCLSAYGPGDGVRAWRLGRPNRTPIGPPSYPSRLT